MIRPLRQRHRRTVITLGVMLPIVFIVGIAARKPVPTMAQPAAPAGGSSTVFWDRSDLFAKAAIRVQLAREKANGGVTVEFSAPRDFVKPDLIVYWVAGNSKITETLPDNALLLGSFSAGPLVLPTPAIEEEGHLLLYSLADHEIVTDSKTFHVP